ncbi:hypothetical protein HBB16_12315 [Pseudonocardia sp. MCCB 268]|nr:hypothetical protein [Pseudonocardia cytotoxica]
MTGHVNSTIASCTGCTARPGCWAAWLNVPGQGQDDVMTSRHVLMTARSCPCQNRTSPTSPHRR